MGSSTTGAVRGGSDAAPVKPLGEIFFAAVILSIGIVGFVAGAGIQTPDSASDIGPRALPYLVSGLLVIVGAGLIVQLLRGKTGEADEGEDIDPNVRTDWLTVAKMAGTVVVHIFLIIPLGWPVAAAVLFFGAAWALGAKPLWRAAVVGAVMALLLQFAFGGLLGVSLPAGVLEGVPFLNG